jgi:hypothetical protein
MRLVESFGSPITATSANRTGAPSPVAVEDVLADDGPRAAVLQLVADLVAGVDGADGRDGGAALQGASGARPARAPRPCQPSRLGEAAQG